MPVSHGGGIKTADQALKFLTQELKKISISSLF